MERSPPLPVLAVLGEALGSVLGNLGALVRIAWPYYALAAALLLADRAASGWAAPGTAEPAAPGLLAVAAAVAVALGMLACQIRWQRHVILGEPLQGMAPLTGRVPRFFLWTVALVLIAAAPALVALALGIGTGLIVERDGEAPLGIGAGGILLLAAGVLAGMYLFARLALVLPAVSVDDRGLRLKAAFAATRDQGLRLLALAVLVCLGLGLFGAVAGLVSAALASAFEPGGTGALLVPTVLDAAVDLVSAVMGAAVGAAVYRRLITARASASPA